MSAGSLTPMSTEKAAAETRDYGRSAGLLTLALGSAGVLIYAFFALASHTLDSDQYGEIVVLWSIVFVVGATLFRPIEQLLSRSLAEHEQLGEGTGHVLRVAAGIQGGLAVLSLVLLLALREPIEDNLLGGGDVLFWVLVGALVGFGAAYYARGFLAGRRQFGLYSVLLMIEGLARLRVRARGRGRNRRGRGRGGARHRPGAVRRPRRDAVRAARQAARPAQRPGRAGERRRRGGRARVQLSRMEAPSPPRCC